MRTIYTVGQASKVLHKTVRTLQKWDKAGHLVAFRTPTNRRYYTHQQLMEFLGFTEKQENKKIVAYCRVSSVSQKQDLKNQRTILEGYCNAAGIPNVEFVEEIGGGMNFKRKKFRDLMSQVHAGEVSKIIIAHKDRLSRFGFDHIEWECNYFDCTIDVLNSEQLSPEQEMVQDLMTIVHCFSSRLYGLRNYRKELTKALQEK